MNQDACTALLFSNFLSEWSSLLLPICHCSTIPICHILPFSLLPYLFVRDRHASCAPDPISLLFPIPAFSPLDLPSSISHPASADASTDQTPQPQARPPVNPSAASAATGVISAKGLAAAAASPKLSQLAAEHNIGHKVFLLTHPGGDSIGHSLHTCSSNFNYGRRPSAATARSTPS